MKGRQVIKVGRRFDTDELLDYLIERWDGEHYPEPRRFARPAIGDYIILPATERFCILVYPSKEKVVAISYPTGEGWKQSMACSLPTHNIFAGVAKIMNNASREKERKGPVEQILLNYTEYLKTILPAA